MIPQAVMDIQNRAELSVPLLKHIKDSKSQFKVPLKKLKEEIQGLSMDKSYEEFDNVMEDVKNRSKGTMKFKLDIVNKMIDLVKEACQYQFELNKMIKPYCSMANIIKTKGKKFLNENLKSNDQGKLLKFVVVLLRHDFITNVIHTIEIGEVVYIMKLLESQGSLVNEYKKTLVKGIDEFQLVNSVEFEIIVEKYQQVMNEINIFQQIAFKNFEMTKFNKDIINQVLKDIKRVVDKYKEFQNGIYHYQEILELFQKIRNLAGKFCYREFNTKVELICEFNI
jgi:chemotaxis regulatin CheY-phosphate phosphatase CheZ